MQIVDNWSDVEGELKHFSPSTSDPSAFSVATIKVERALPVDKFPNLLAQRVGQEITISIPKESLAGRKIAPGAHVCLRVRQAALNKFFSHPDHAIDTE